MAVHYETEERHGLAVSRSCKLIYVFDNRQDGVSHPSGKHWLDYVAAWGTLAAALVAAFAASIAVWQARIMQQSAEQQLRAYIVVQPAEIPPGTNPLVQDKIHYRFSIRNIGQTPAYELSAQYKARTLKATTFSSDSLEEFDFPEIFDLGPGGSENSFIDLYLKDKAKSIIQEVKDKKLQLLIEGKIDYQDVFKSKRSKNFCYEIVFTNNSEFGFSRCLVGNDGN